jgi:hypothetical protein
MASLTERYNNPWALKADTLQWAQETYGKDNVVGLDKDNFIIFKDVDAGRRAMEQEHRVEVGKGVNVGQHLATHVGAEVDSAGYQDALNNVPVIASQLSNQPVTMESLLADIDPVVYQKTVAKQEGMGPEGMKTFFPEQDSTGVNNSDSLLPELLSESDRQPKLQTRPVATEGIVDTEYDPDVPFLISSKNPYHQVLPSGNEMYNRYGTGAPGANAGDSIYNEEGALINDPFETRLKRIMKERSPSLGNLQVRPIDLNQSPPVDEQQKKPSSLLRDLSPLTLQDLLPQQEVNNQSSPVDEQQERPTGKISSADEYGPKMIDGELFVGVEPGTDYTRVYNKSDLLSNLVRFGAQNKDFMPDFLRQQHKMSNPLRGLVVDPMDDYSQLDLDISKDQRFTPENKTPPSETLFSRIQTPPTLQPDEAFDIGTQESKDDRFSKWVRETKRIQDANVAAEEEVDEVGVDETQDPSTDLVQGRMFPEGEEINLVASTEGDEIDQIITEEEQKTSPTVAPKLTTTTPSSMTTEVPPATTARTDGMMGGKMLPTLLQALGAGGASYLENKAIKDANKATGQNQARANLINALARGGRAGAVTETPTTGMGTALFKSLSSLGEGEERRRKEAADESYRQQRLDLDKEKLAADTENKKNVLAAKNTVAELKSHKDAVTQISEFLENGAKSGRVNYKNYKEQIAASPAIAQLFAQLPDSHKSLALSGLALGLSTRETPPEPVELKSMVQTMRDLYYAIEDPSNWLKAAGYKRLGSLGEVLYGTEGDFDSIIQSQFMPARTTYDGVRSANTLRLASAFNQGRPSDKDAQLVSRLIPQFGLSEAVNEARFAVLEQMAALAEEMAKTGFDPLAAGYGENFLTQSGAVIIGKDGVPKLDVEKLRRIYGSEPTETATTTSTGQQAKGKVIVKSVQGLPYDKTIQVKK